MGQSAGFLSFSFLPNCSQELTLGGSRCLTELLLCNALCCPGAPQCWEGQKAWHHLHLLINAQQQKLLGTGPVPSHPSPELALSTTVCKCLLACLQEQGFSLPLLHQGVKASQPTGREAVCVLGGWGAFTSAALNAQVKRGHTGSKGCSQHTGVWLPYPGHKPPAKVSPGG